MRGMRAEVCSCLLYVAYTKRSSRVLDFVPPVILTCCLPSEIARAT